MGLRIAASSDWNLDLPGHEVITWDGPIDGPVDIAVAPHDTPADIVERATALCPKLLQLGSIGYDSVSRDIPDSMVVANAASVHETSTAEHTIAMVLTLARQFDRSARAQHKRIWDTFNTTGLADSTVLIIGAGGVGRAIAERLAPFEVHLKRVATSKRSDDLGDVDAIEDLDRLLPDADVVIVVVPHNDSTHHLINDEFLSTMKDGAILVNVARGKVADTEALLAHARRIRLALDVTDPEPLPDGHPLFSAAELITAHNGGNADAMIARMASLVERQTSHLEKGEPFENVVLP